MKSFVKIAAATFIVGGLLVFIYLFCSIYSYLRYYEFKKIDLNNSESKSVVAERFEFVPTDNGEICQFGYDPEDGRMCVLIKNVENIHELYFENLSYYGYTEEEFKVEFNRPFDSFSNVQSKFLGQEYQGVITHMQKDDDGVGVCLFRCNGVLYCELGKEVDWEFVDEVNS